MLGYQVFSKLVFLLRILMLSVWFSTPSRRKASLINQGLLYPFQILHNIYQFHISNIIIAPNLKFDIAKLCTHKSNGYNIFTATSTTIYYQFQLELLNSDKYKINYGFLNLFGQNKVFSMRNKILSPVRPSYPQIQYKLKTQNCRRLSKVSKESNHA